MDKIIEHDTTVKYVVELGIDVPGEGRVCAVESRPYRTRTEALIAAWTARGKAAAVILGRRGYESYDADPADMHRPIVGATVNTYSDAYGTDHDLTRHAY